MILIFGGTTEGRMAVDACEEVGTPYFYSTISNIQTVEMHHGVRLVGVMEKDDIMAFCEKKGIRCIIDAAHPFAENLHRNIAECGVKTIRLQRKLSERIDGATYCQGYDDAISKIRAAKVKILLALSGANTIEKFAPLFDKSYFNVGENNPDKVLFRILNNEKSKEIALKFNLKPAHLIYYNKDYSIPTKDEEKTLMLNTLCDAIITKESGMNGGFAQKVEAALELGLKVFVIEAPALPEQFFVVNNKEELMREIRKNI